MNRPLKTLLALSLLASTGASCSEITAPAEEESFSAGLVDRVAWVAGNWELRSMSGCTGLAESNRGAVLEVGEGGTARLELAETTSIHDVSSRAFEESAFNFFESRSYWVYELRFSPGLTRAGELSTAEVRGTALVSGRQEMTLRDATCTVAFDRVR